MRVVVKLNASNSSQSLMEKLRVTDASMFPDAGTRARQLAVVRLARAYVQSMKSLKRV